MPKRSSIPQLTRHASGQAVVRLNGKDHYLGKHGTPESEAAYETLIARWLAHGRSLPNDAVVVTINELALAFICWAQDYYVDHGKKLCSETEGIKQAVKILRLSYGRLPVTEFGPRKLKEVRDAFIRKGWCRNYVNRQVNRLKRMFRWGVEEELVPSSVYHALQAVPALPKGKTTVPESEPVTAVPVAQVEAALPHMPAPVAAMVRLQMLTGMRPGEAVIMRAIDIDQSGPVWVYRPPHRKTQHRGHSREIYLGPKAQVVLTPWLDRAPEQYLFSPKEAEESRHADRRANRKTPMTPSQAKRGRKAHPKRETGKRYDVGSYRQAITRACDRAFPPPEPLAQRPGESAKEWQARLPESEQEKLRAWQREHRFHPNQLRHLAATLIRKERGIELARIVLGHSTAFTTEIYAEADRTQAMDLIREFG